MKRENYRGFVIEAGRFELQNDLGWSMKLVIEKHYKDGVAVKDIPVMGIFKSEESAVESSLAYGREVIDAGFSV